MSGDKTTSRVARNTVRPIRKRLLGTPGADGRGNLITKLSLPKLEPAPQGRAKRTTRVKQRVVAWGADQAKFLSQMSSDSMESLTLEGSTPSDFLYTWFFRYPRLLAHDINNPDGTGNGATIDYTVSHNWAAALVFVFVVGVTAYNIYYEYKKQKKIFDNNSYGRVYTKFDADKEAVIHQVEENIALEALQKNERLLGEIWEENKEEFEKQYENVSLVDGRLKFKKKENINSYEDDALAKQIIAIVIAKETQKRKNDELNAYFEQIRQEDEKLKKKYRSVRINENNQIVFDYTGEYSEEEEPTHGWFHRLTDWWKRNPVNNKFLSPVFQGLFIAAAVYWSMYIGMGTFTGIFSEGIAGLGWAAFIVPFVFTLTYWGIKTVNYFKNKQKAPQNVNQELEDEEQKQATKDAVEMIRRAKIRQVFDSEKKALFEALGLGEKEQHEWDESIKAKLNKHSQHSHTLSTEVNYLQRNLKTKTAATFVSTTGGTAVWLEYAFWILSDFVSACGKALSSVPGFNLVAGSLLLGFSVLRGIYKAAKSYFDRSEDKEKAKNLESDVADIKGKVGTLEGLYNARLARFNELKKATGADLPCDPIKFGQDQFFNDINRRGPKTTSWQKIGRLLSRGELRKAFSEAVGSTRVRRAFANFWVVSNAFTTGAFLARLFLVANNAPIMPWVVATGAGLMSNPVTIGIVVAAGLLWAGLKLYEYHRNRKEARAKQIIEKYSERMECLTQQIKLLDLSILVMEKKPANNAKAAEQILPNDDVKTPEPPEKTPSCLSSLKSFFNRQPRGGDKLAKQPLLSIARDEVSEEVQKHNAAM